MSVSLDPGASTPIQQFVEKLKALAHEVYENLRSGYSESHYQEAFLVELRLAGIKYERERVVSNFYKGHFIGVGRVDIVVSMPDGALIPVEVKVKSLKEEFREQLRAYMKGVACDHGVLVYFPQPGTDPLHQDSRTIVRWARKDDAGAITFYEEREGIWCLETSLKKERAVTKSKQAGN